MDKELEKLNDFYELAMQKAHEWGLEPFPIDFHVVPAHKIYEVASYGIPNHFSHWSYGKDYWQQKSAYDRGRGRIYELVINANPSQAFLLDTNTLLDNLFVIAHVIGHCYIPGTKVRTITGGIKNIEDITIVDTVLNADNKYSTVIPTNRYYSGYVINLMAGGQSFTQTSEHKLLASKGKAGTPEWVCAKDIEIGDYLISKTIEPDGSIEDMTIASVPYFGKQASRSKSTFSVPLNEEIGELIGLYLAEGYSRDGGQCGLCFHTNETDLHERSKYLVEKYFNLKTYDDINLETHSHQVQFNNKQVSAFLAQFGRKSHNKNLGIWLLTASNKEFLKGVLKGFILGDGHIGDRSISFSTTSPHLAWQIPAIAQMFGVYFNTNVRNRENRREAWEPHVSGPHSRALRALLELDSEAIDINREWSNSHKFDGYMYVKVTGKEVSEYDGTVYCLNAENGHSFTLANGCITHNSDFFAQNAYFDHTNRRMEMSALAARERFREYEIQYGRDVVEDFIDDVFSIKEHIDPHLRTKEKSIDYEIVFDANEYLDLMPEEVERRRQIELAEYYKKNNKWPQEQQRDLMKFISANGRLKDWQKDIMDTIREEMIYFLPQMQTKIMNEGWASIMHHELMHELDVECDPLGIDFADVHSGVLSPYMGNLNPYWLGYNLFKRIIEKGDEDAGLKGDEVGKPNGPGWKNALEARVIERDETFLRNYIDEKVCEKLDLFTFEFEKKGSVWWISEKEWELVRDNLVSTKANMGFPYIVIDDGDYNNTGVLYLKHKFDNRPLDEKWAAKTLRSIYRLWGRPVILESYTDDGKNTKTFECKDKYFPVSVDDNMEERFYD